MPDINATCDIDKLRDLVRRQDRAKKSYFEPGWGLSGREPLDAADVERQVITYLAQGTTVAALTKCVEKIEAEAKVRVTKGREKHEEMEQKKRILRVCDHAMDPKKHYGGDFTSYTLERDVEIIKREIGDPYA